MLGRRVATLADGQREAGAYTASFDASGLAAGTYVYLLATPAGSETRRMTIAR
ncbi:MAG: hypothetical protein AAGF99_14465 [Bacteroidota bacterium]